MGRYVLIFTVVTVLYLPPTFISTVFALEIFQTDTTETKVGVQSSTSVGVSTHLRCIPCRYYS